MAEDKTSILLSNVSIEGDLVEKDKIVLDAKITGDIKAEEIETHSNSYCSNTNYKDKQIDRKPNSIHKKNGEININQNTRNYSFEELNNSFGGIESDEAVAIKKSFSALPMDKKNSFFAYSNLKNYTIMSVSLLHV